MRRATRVATDTAKRANMGEWTTMHFRRKWRRAGRVAALPYDRCARLAASWEPDFHDRRPALRRHGGQRKSWEDDIAMFFEAAAPVERDNQRWLTLAQDSAKWSSLGTAFLQHTQHAAPTVENIHLHT